MCAFTGVTAVIGKTTKRVSSSGGRNIPWTSASSEQPKSWKSISGSPPCRISANVRRIDAAAANFLTQLSRARFLRQHCTFRTVINPLLLSLLPLAKADHRSPSLGRFAAAVPESSAAQPTPNAASCSNLRWYEHAAQHIPSW